MPLRLLVLALLVACDGTGGTTVTVLDNQGTACVDEAAGTVQIDFETCLSSSCDTLEGASCNATWSGDTLTVTSTASVVSTGGDCTADCGFATASCDLPDGVDVDAGTLSYGGAEVALADAACEDGV